MNTVEQHRMISDGCGNLIFDGNLKNTSINECQKFLHNASHDLERATHFLSQIEAQHRQEVCNLLADTEKYNDCFESFTRWREDLPIVQRNLLIGVARNHVRYAKDDSDSFTTNTQEFAMLPKFNCDGVTATILDALVAKMRREIEAAKAA